MTIDRRDTGVDEAAVAAFLDRVDEALVEYDQGYADADATLRVLREHVEDLRDATGG
jgi:cell division septum initiation protein DivIVA